MKKEKTILEESKELRNAWDNFIVVVAKYLRIPQIINWLNPKK